ncbi:MAG: hypothetical protein HQL17_00505 [Candidatus Omnitrophica bacterium]|nr:hypothetical protein [Candidatus Omnitrophota bacterium]
MTVKIVRDRITHSALEALAQEAYVEMVKAVADLRKGVVAFGGEMHTDAQAALMAEGSAKKDLWGFCLVLGRPFADAFDFTSHINIRPEDGNPSVKIKDPDVRRSVVELTAQRVDWSH